jgi:NAD(P)-dependent dehydrogenase (short-subunit alcohol dehydrogenase family)
VSRSEDRPPILDIPDADWHTGIDVNLSSQFYCARATIPHMVARKRGKIINIASGYGLRGGKHNYMYACAKGASLQLTRSLALTYADDNIQESDRRNRRTLLTIESGFLRAKDRAKQTNAGTAKVGGQRPGYPKLPAQKRRIGNPG